MLNCSKAAPNSRMIKVKRQVTAWIVEASQTAPCFGSDTSYLSHHGWSLSPSLSLRHWRVSVCETARAGVFKQRGNAWKISPPITPSICPALAAHCPHPAPGFVDHGRLKLGAVFKQFLWSNVLVPWRIFMIPVHTEQRTCENCRI